MRVFPATSAGNLRHSADLLQIYAFVLENGWKLPSELVPQRRFDPPKFIA